jgi:hypothetical protein
MRRDVGVVGLGQLSAWVLLCASLVGGCSCAGRGPAGPADAGAGHSTCVPDIAFQSQPDPALAVTPKVAWVRSYPTLPATEQLVLSNKYIVAATGSEICTFSRTDGSPVKCRMAELDTPLTIEIMPDGDHILILGLHVQIWTDDLVYVAIAPLKPWTGRPRPLITPAGILVNDQTGVRLLDLKDLHEIWHTQSSLTPFWGTGAFWYGVSFVAQDLLSLQSGEGLGLNLDSGGGDAKLSLPTPIGGAGVDTDASDPRSSPRAWAVGYDRCGRILWKQSEETWVGLVDIQGDVVGMARPVDSDPNYTKLVTMDSATGEITATTDGVAGPQAVGADGTIYTVTAVPVGGTANAVTLTAFSPDLKKLWSLDVARGYMGTVLLGDDGAMYMDAADDSGHTLAMAKILTPSPGLARTGKPSTIGDSHGNRWLK